MVLLFSLRLDLKAYGKSVEVGLALAVKSVGYTSDDARETIERLRKALYKTPIHALLVVAPSVEDEAARKLQLACEELGIKLLMGRVPRIIDRVRLGAVGKAISEAASIKKREAHELAKNLQELREFLDVGLVEAVLRDIVEDLGIVGGLKELLEPPYAISELFMDGAIRKYEDVVGAMKWFLSVPRKRVAVTEVFDYVSKNVAGFHVYRRGRKYRGVLTLDIESLDKLKEVAAILHRNGFVEYDPRTGIVDTSRLSPVEERLVKILNNVFNGVAKVEDLRRFFVELSPNASRIWSSILAILELRGLLCVDRGSRRCPGSPGKGYVVSLTGDRVGEYVGEIVEDALSLAKELSELEGYGYVVVGKERGFRAFTVRQLVSVIEDLVSKIRDYSGIDPSMAARLANLLNSLATYVREVILPEIRSARERMLLLRRELDDLYAKCLELVDALRNMLESYVASNNVEIKLGILDKLESARRKLREIEETVFSDEELRKAVEELWTRSRGKAFPFYFDSLAPTYHYNYKLYLVHRELGDLVEISSESGELCVREEVRRVPEKLEKIVMMVRSSIERVYRIENTETLAQTLRRCETLRRVSEFVKKIDVTRIDVDPINAANCDDLSRAVRSIIDRWTKSMRLSMESVKRAAELAEEVFKLERELVERMEELTLRVDRITHILSRCPALFDNSLPCASELDNVKEVVSDAKRMLEELTSREVEISSLSDVLKIEESVRDALKKLLDTLSVGTLQHCSKLEEEVKSKLYSLSSSAKSLYELLNKLRIEVPRERLALSERALEALKRGDYEELCVCMYELGKLVKELRSLALRSGVLEELDLEVYSSLSELKRESRGRLSLDEAAKVVSERLCMPFDRVWSSVVRLIDMRLLEVYL